MPALVVRRLLWRGTLFWIGVRVLLLLVAGTAHKASDGQLGSGGPESHPLLFGAILSAMALHDLRRRNEVIFLANIGIGRRHAVAGYIVPGVLLELLLGQLL